MKSTSFKQQLPRFFLKDWAEQWHASVLDGRELYVGVETECVRFRGVNGEVEVSPIPHLGCNHPEADTRICLHLIDASRSFEKGDLVVRATDTDILVIILHHSDQISLTVWMDIGTSVNRRYVNLSAIAGEIGRKLCMALPAWLPCIHSL